MNQSTELNHHPAAALFPMLDEMELGELADDIAANGLLYPITLYDDPELGTVVLDGRNRLAACARAGVEPVFTKYSGGDPIGFAVSLNVKRRHLTPGQKDMLGLDVLPLYEAEARARQVATLKQNATVGADRRQRDEENKSRAPRAADNAAKATGSSPRGVQKAKRVQEKAPDLAAKVRSGDLAIDRANRIVRDRESAEKRQAEAAATLQQLDAGTIVDIRHGDFREVLADLSNVDAIITDPPYPREFLPLLGDLGEWADRVLAPDGVLAVLIGQSYLPDVYRLLDGSRPYRWTACYLTPGHGYASHPRRVQSNWKPVLVYGGGQRFADVFRSTGSDAAAKDRHFWGQDYGAFHDIVERLTKAGDTVVDPFMGSGTTLAAAKALGRHAIGCDTELEHVETARKWLA